MLNAKNSMGEVAQPIRFKGGINITADEFAEMVRNCAEEEGVPVIISSDTIHSGGFFNGHDYPCIVLKHPNPPQEYFYQVWTINGNAINFNYFGRSKANYKVNTYNQKKNGGLFDQISAAISGSAEMELQVEMGWQHDVYDLFDTAVRKANGEE